MDKLSGHWVEADPILQGAMACLSSGEAGPKAQVCPARALGGGRQKGERARRTGVRSWAHVLQPQRWVVLSCFRPPCSLASCHFSGAGCQNCRRRLLRGSARPRPAPPRPSALIMGRACVSTHAATQRGATSNITETPPPPNLTSLPPRQECREKHGVKGSPFGSAHTPRTGQRPRP